MTREEWKERLPLIQAFVEGKQVEMFTTYCDWRLSEEIDFGGPSNHYRIQPSIDWSKPVRQKNGTKLRFLEKLTAQQFPMLCIATFKDRSQTCYFYNEDGTSAGGNRDYDAENYQKKLRPWTFDEVPLGALYRQKGANGWVDIIMDVEKFNLTPIRLRDRGGDMLVTALRDREHSTDNGLTWKPCGVEE